jgi:hypothetical protein
MIGEDGRDATAVRLPQEAHRNPTGEGVEVHHIGALIIQDAAKCVARLSVAFAVQVAQISDGASYSKAPH